MRKTNRKLKSKRSAAHKAAISRGMRRYFARMKREAKGTARPKRRERS